MRTASVNRRAAGGGDARPRASVVIATCDRAPLLPGLLAALEAQSVCSFEVVLVDDGSSDDTWGVLEAWTRRSPLPSLALRIDATGGPSVPRNTGVGQARSDLLLFTDDDCLPEPGWVAAVLAAFDEGAALVRGPIRPVDEPHDAWDRSIDVSWPTPWFETANLALRRRLFDDVGGFPVLDVLGKLPAPRGFGEDVVLGQRAAALVGQVWEEGATVRHRWLAGSFADHLRGQRRLVGFPALVREVPGLRGDLAFGLFLNRRTAAFALAAVSGAMGVTTRRPLAVLAALPWVRQAWPDARGRGHRSAPLRLLQLVMGDAVGALSLVEGSMRHRSPVL